MEDKPTLHDLARRIRQVGRGDYTVMGGAKIFYPNSNPNATLYFIESDTMVKKAVLDKAITRTQEVVSEAKDLVSFKTINTLHPFRGSLQHPCFWPTLGEVLDQICQSCTEEELSLVVAFEILHSSTNLGNGNFQGTAILYRQI